MIAPVILRQRFQAALLRSVFEVRTLQDSAQRGAIPKGVEGKRTSGLFLSLQFGRDFLKIVFELLPNLRVYCLLSMIVFFSVSSRQSQPILQTCRILLLLLQ